MKVESGVNVEYLLSHAITHLPVVLVLIVGLSVLAVRRAHIPPRTVAFAIAGCVALLVGIAVGAGWALLMPSLIRDSSVASIGIVGSGFGLVQALVDATGVALLIASVLSARAPASTA